MNKKYRHGKTVDIYCPIAFSQEVKTLIRRIDDMEKPLEAIALLIKVLEMR